MTSFCMVVGVLLSAGAALTGSVSGTPSTLLAPSIVSGEKQQLDDVPRTMTVSWPLTGTVTARVVEVTDDDTGDVTLPAELINRVSRGVSRREIFEELHDQQPQLAEASPIDRYDGPLRYDYRPHGAPQPQLAEASPIDRYDGPLRYDYRPHGAPGSAQNEVTPDHIEEVRYSEEERRGNDPSDLQHGVNDPTSQQPAATEYNPYQLFPESFHDLLDIPVQVFKNGTQVRTYQRPRRPTVSGGYANTHLQGYGVARVRTTPTTRPPTPRRPTTTSRAATTTTAAAAASRPPPRRQPTVAAAVVHFVTTTPRARIVTPGSGEFGARVRPDARRPVTVRPSREQHDRFSAHSFGQSVAAAAGAGDQSGSASGAGDQSGAGRRPLHQHLKFGRPGGLKSRGRVPFIPRPAPTDRRQPARDVTPDDSRVTPQSVVTTDEPALPMFAQFGRRRITTTSTTAQPAVATEATRAVYQVTSSNVEPPSWHLSTEPDATEEHRKPLRHKKPLPEPQVDNQLQKPFRLTTLHETTPTLHQEQEPRQHEPQQEQFRPVFPEASIQVTESPNLQSGPGSGIQQLAGPSFGPPQRPLHTPQTRPRPPQAPSPFAGHKRPFDRPQRPVHSQRPLGRPLAAGGGNGQRRRRPTPPPAGGYFDTVFSWFRGGGDPPAPAVKPPVRPRESRPQPSPAAGGGGSWGGPSAQVDGAGTGTGTGSQPADGGWLRQNSLSQPDWTRAWRPSSAGAPWRRAGRPQVQRRRGAADSLVNTLQMMHPRLSPPSVAQVVRGPPRAAGYLLAAPRRRPPTVLGRPSPLQLPPAAPAAQWAGNQTVGQRAGSPAAARPARAGLPEPTVRPATLLNDHRIMVVGPFVEPPPGALHISYPHLLASATTHASQRQQHVSRSTPPAVPSSGSVTKSRSAPTTADGSVAAISDTTVAAKSSAVQLAATPPSSQLTAPSTAPIAARREQPDRQSVPARRTASVAAAPPGADNAGDVAATGRAPDAAALRRAGVANASRPPHGAASERPASPPMTSSHADLTSSAATPRQTGPNPPEFRLPELYSGFRPMLH